MRQIKKYSLIFHSIIALVTIGMSSCVNEEQFLQHEDMYGNSLYATMTGTVTGSTRSTVDGQDYWSTTAFSSNDTIGLYAQSGNMDGNGSFINAPMIFTRAVSSTFQFDNPALNIDRTQFKYNSTMLYFPYTAGMEENGLKLRKKVNGIDRCIDLLFMGNLNSDDLNKKQQLSGNFNHAFSELIIIRGEGFENATNKEINVVTNTPCTRVRFIDHPNPNTGNVQEIRNAWKIPDLYFDASDGLDELQSRSWKAWHGSDFTINHETGPQEAYYVMIPNVYYYRISGSNVMQNVGIDYIEMYDNNDQLQRISSFSLSDDGTKLLTNGTRYPIEVKMEGLVPTITPYKILSWDETEDITDERTIGIKADNYNEWLNTYNQYTADPAPGDKYNDKLLEYGDMHIDEAAGHLLWHFYILEDINFKGMQNIRISKLDDILDGQGNQLSNLNLTDSFIGELTESGSLINMNIRGLSVTNSDKSGRTVGIGALIGLLNGGSLQKCDVNATVSANCNVGIMAGDSKGGSVVDCNFSGLLIGEGSSAAPYRYLIGLTPQGNALTIKDTNFSGIIFTKKD